MAKYQFRVEVQPRYLPEQSAPAQGIFSFAYTITITNAGELSAQLISRHWVISNSAGETEEVKGLGVVGQQPLLKPGEAFQYTSGCRLRTASGRMQGSFFFVSELNARLRKMLLPATPETSDSSELFSLAVPHAADPARVAAFDGPTLDRIARLIMTPAPVTGPPL
jgi:ApaG protein